MAFYIKVCNPTYFDIKVHTFMAVPLSCGAIKKIGKNSLIIFVSFCYTKNVQKTY